MASKEEQVLLKDETDCDLDVDTVPQRTIMPIEGYQRMPLVSLEEAVMPLLTFTATIDRKAELAKCYAKEEKSTLLPIDQHAAIKLYTMEWSPATQSLYYCLNTALRDQCREKLKPWFLYLKLLLTAVAQLPSTTCNVLRGVRKDLRAEYRTGTRVVWWSFSSCTTDMGLLKGKKFLGARGPRTVFIIEARTAKNIRPFSQFKKDSELLLAPGAQFEVLRCFERDDGLVLVHMKEINVAYSLIDFPEPVGF